jgi:uncharacterized integral membrane protein
MLITIPVFQERKMMAIVILLLIVMSVVAVFSIQNALPVAITFFYWKFEASLAIIVFLSVLCGMIAGAIILSLLRMKPSTRKIGTDSAAEKK